MLLEIARERGVGFASFAAGLLLLAAEASAQAPGRLEENWEAAYLGGVKIGHVHTMTDRLEAGGQTIVQVRQESVLSIKRFDDIMRLTMVTDSYEFLDGRLYAVRSKLRMANQEQRTDGQLAADGKFHITVKTTGKEEKHQIEWRDDILGQYAYERLLREKPMKPGEVRSFTTFAPEINQIATLKSRALDYEEVTVADDQKKKLLAVEQEMVFEDGQQKLPKFRVWIDDEGRVQRTMMTMLPGMTIVSLRVGRSAALEAPTGEDVDLGVQTLVKMSKPIAGAHRSSAIEYLVTAGDADAVAGIPEAEYQKIIARHGTALTMRVTRRAPPPADKRGMGEVEPEYLASNGFVQSDNPKILEIARQAIGDASDPWQKALRLERWVDANMSDNDFSVGFATAGEVIQTLQGDCTEHAVLLAALCRAVEVPARVAMGLVYVESLQAFGYHMWTEVFIGDQWYALDGTLGAGGIGGGHIKLAHASLKGASAISTFLPIYKVIGKLAIETKRVE